MIEYLLCDQHDRTQLFIQMMMLWFVAGRSIDRIEYDEKRLISEIVPQRRVEGGNYVNNDVAHDFVGEPKRASQKWLIVFRVVAFGDADWPGVLQTIKFVQERSGRSRFG